MAEDGGTIRMVGESVGGNAPGGRDTSPLAPGGRVIGADLIRIFPSGPDLGKTGVKSPVPGDGIEGMPVDKLTEGDLGAVAGIGGAGNPSIVIDGTRRLIVIRDTSGVERIRIGNTT